MFGARNHSLGIKFCVHRTTEELLCTSCSGIPRFLLKGGKKSYFANNKNSQLATRRQRQRVEKKNCQVFESAKALSRVSKCWARRGNAFCSKAIKIKCDMTEYWRHLNSSADLYYPFSMSCIVLGNATPAVGVPFPTLKFQNRSVLLIQSLQ